MAIDTQSIIERLGVAADNARAIRERKLEEAQRLATPEPEAVKTVISTPGSS